MPIWVDQALTLSLAAAPALNSGAACGAGISPSRHRARPVLPPVQAGRASFATACRPVSRGGRGFARISLISATSAGGVIAPSASLFSVNHADLSAPFGDR